MIRADTLVLIIVVIIIGAIIYNYVPIGSLSNNNLVDIADNPEKYEGQEVTIEGTINWAPLPEGGFGGYQPGPQIYTSKEDGSFAHLEFSYKGETICYKAKLTGIIVAEGQGRYHLDVSRFICLIN